MKNYNVSKEFIIEAYAAACDEWKQKIEVQFPDLFKPGVEPGKWYKFGASKLIYIKDIDKNGYANVYGFSAFGWFERSDFLAVGGYHEGIKATDREVEIALTQEAYRRGLCKGDNTIKGLRQTTHAFSPFTSIIFYSSANRLCSNADCILFEDGVWAELKKQKTYKVGDKIIIDDDDTYLICRVGTNTISLVSCAGESWDYTVQVVNENKITEKELNDHIGDYKWERA